MMSSKNITKEFYTSWIDKYNVTIFLSIDEDIDFSSKVYTRPLIISVLDDETATAIQLL